MTNGHVTSIRALVNNPEGGQPIWTTVDFPLGMEIVPQVLHSTDSERHGHDIRFESHRSVSQVRFKESLKFEPRLVIESDIIKFSG